MIGPVDVAFPNPSELGEGSLWDTEQQRLYWVDIVQQKVFCFDPRNGSNLAFDVGESVGTVVLTKQGLLLLALRSGFATLDPRSGRLQRLSDPEAHLEGNRFNDGKCDPRGRFWAGTMVEKGPSGGANLYCLHRDLRVERVLEGVSCSNGLAWTADERRLYYVDTPTRQVHAFDFDAETGALSGRRVVFEVPAELGAPDGMTIDSDDHLWLALWGGGRVVRVDPVAGKLETELAIPAHNVTSCAFGGEGLNDLYVTTARVGTPAERLAALPLAGSLFRVRLPWHGVPAPRFAGEL